MIIPFSKAYYWFGYTFLKVLALDDASKMTLLHSKVRTMTNPCFTIDDVTNIVNIDSTEIINGCLSCLSVLECDAYVHKLLAIYDESIQQLTSLSITDDLSKQITKIVHTFFLQT